MTKCNELNTTSGGVIIAAPTNDLLPSKYRSSPVAGVWLGDQFTEFMNG